MASDDDLEFTWEDYVVFSASLFLSLTIGSVFAWYTFRRNTTKEYLLGGGEMNPVAMGLSMTASVLNAIFLIGIPAEIYYFGTVYAWLFVAFLICLIISCLVFIPFYRHNNFVSIYQYLGERFDSTLLTVLASLTFTVAMVFFLAVVLYTPALAFEAVTGLSIHITQIACGLVCTIYVVLGGFRAVVWTDAIQMLIIIAGTITVVVIGSNDVDGNIIDIAKEDNRWNFYKDDTDFTERHTVWTQCIGQVFNWIPIMVANQMLVQRYSAVSSTPRAMVATCVAIGTTNLLLILVTASGLVMYATYRDCDPYVVAKRVDESDQIFPLLVMEVLGDYRGLPGLYVAAVFAAALSSVSSAINSLTAVFLEDFIKPVYSYFHGKEQISEGTATWISRALCLILGGASIGLSYVAPHMGDELIEIPPTIWGSFMAPLLGVFVLAMFCPWSNKIGAISALLITLTFSMWMTVGGIMHGRDRVPIMPIGFCRPDMPAANPDNPMMDNVTYATTLSTTPYATTEGFYVTTAENNATTMNMDVIVPKTTEEPELEDFYSISYAWYGLINLLICVTLGNIISVITNLICHGSLRGDTDREINDWWRWFRNHVLHKESGASLNHGYKNTELNGPNGKSKYEVNDAFSPDNL